MQNFFLVNLGIKKECKMKTAGIDFVKTGKRFFQRRTDA
ncbi:hypothetical protein R80B4_03279 [Fibrobacteres bacterium R8-0-B4]